jgi:hypothetical protein
MSAGAVPSSEYLITTTVLTQAEPSVTFDVSAFNGVYKHLQIRLTARTTLTDVHGLFMRLNEDSGSNYSWHFLRNNPPSGVLSGSSTSTTSMALFRAASNNSAANAFGALVIDILDPFETNKNTTIRALGGNTAETNPYIWFQSGAWFNTASVSTIMIQAQEGASLAQGSRFSLYGVTV